MKTIFILLLTISINLTALGQSKSDVIYLKNGSIIKGTVIEDNPPEEIRIRTPDKNLFIFKYDEVERVEKATKKGVKVTPAIETEEPDIYQFGGPISVGLALGGGGIAGLPIRVYPFRRVVLEAGIYLRPTYINEVKYETVSYGGPLENIKEGKFAVYPMISVGANVFIRERYYRRSNLIAKNGVMFRYSKTLTSEFSEHIISGGWARERFKPKSKKSSFATELGLSAIIFDYNGVLWDALDVEVNIMPMIYFKFSWNKFLK